jgi:hypothetical protein
VGSGGGELLEQDQGVECDDHRDSWKICRGRIKDNDSRI